MLPLQHPQSLLSAVAAPLRRLLRAALGAGLAAAFPIDPSQPTLRLAALGHALRGLEAEDSSSSPTPAGTAGSQHNMQPDLLAFDRALAAVDYRGSDEEGMALSPCLHSAANREARFAWALRARHLLRLCARVGNELGAGSGGGGGGWVGWAFGSGSGGGSSSSSSAAHALPAAQKALAAALVALAELLRGGDGGEAEAPLRSLARELVDGAAGLCSGSGRGGGEGELAELAEGLKRLQEVLLEEQQGAAEALLRACRGEGRGVETGLLRDENGRPLHSVLLEKVEGALRAVGEAQAARQRS